MDLHAWVADSSGKHHIYYGQMGSLDAPPYAQLDRDDRGGNGNESIKIKGEGWESITIAVENFSKEVPFSRSRAAIRIRLGAKSDVVMRVPESGVGEWWHAVTINNRDEVEVLHRLSDGPPAEM
ncbi:MAG TPA: hypothetical protein VJH03_13735 [Blastocatellia bacterium]|nr:hypothetical protein [Blastocatellia bacterium]